MSTSRELPFDCSILDAAPVLIKNRFTGEGVVLEPDAVAVYDTLIGAEMLGLWETMRKGLDWFRENEPTAYMILLD